MKKLFILLLGVMMSLPTFARDFIYEYEGQTLSYSVTSEEDKTVSVFKCDYLSGDLIIPSIAKDELTGTQYTVTSIGDNAFSICSSLASVNIPDAVTSIGDFAFSGCDNLTSIGIYAFCSCWELNSLTIPEGVTHIGKEAFADCRSMTTVTIPEGVTYIGEQAFANCIGLTSVSLPGSITKIEDYAFVDCYNLTSVYYASKEPITADWFVFGYGENSFFIYNQATLYVPDEAVDKCKKIDPWKYFSKIEAYDFSGLDDVVVDMDADTPCEIYNLNGIKAGESIDKLTPGLYIIRQGRSTKKIAIQ